MRKITRLPCENLHLDRRMNKTNLDRRMNKTNSCVFKRSTIPLQSLNNKKTIPIVKIKPESSGFVKPMSIGDIKIIVTGHNCEKYIEKCLLSIINQTEKNWHCCAVLDPITDETYNIAKQFINDKIQVHLNIQRQYATKNSIDAVKYLNPKDNDVIVWVDADDWLYQDVSLDIMKSYYNKSPHLLVTHGSWIGFPNSNMPTNNNPYTKQDFIENNIRNLSIGNWRGSHLRTMKYCVFKNIKECYLKDIQGNWLKSGYDTSFMFPALEMAGYDRIQFIPEILYVYNRETLFNDDKVNSAWQDECTIYNSNLPPYDLL